MASLKARWEVYGQQCRWVSFQDRHLCGKFAEVLARKRSKTPQPQQIGFDVGTIWNPAAAVKIGKAIGVPANERQLARDNQIGQQGHLNVILIGDVIDLDAGSSGDGGAQLDIRIYEHGDGAKVHGHR